MGTGNCRLDGGFGGKHNGDSKGFTLIEVIVAIGLMAILVTLAVPAIQELIKNNRVAAQSNELVTLIHYARNEAQRRNDTIPMELFSETNGWSGEVRSPDDLEDTEGCTVGVLRCASHQQVLLNEDIDLTFNNRGYLVPFQAVSLQLEHENCSGDRQRRLLEIRPSGQVTGCTVACGETECPE